MILNKINAYINDYRLNRKFEQSLKKQYFSEWIDFISYVDVNPGYINEFKTKPEKMEQLGGYFINSLNPLDVPHFLSFIEKHNINIIYDNGDNLLIRHCIMYEAAMDINSDWMPSPRLYFRNERNIAFPLTLARLLACPLIDINHQNKVGRNALMMLITRKNFEIAQIILDVGVDLQAKNNNGQTALELCLARHWGSGLSNPKQSEFLEKLKAYTQKQELDLALQSPDGMGSFAAGVKSRVSRKI